MPCLTCLIDLTDTGHGWICPGCGIWLPAELADLHFDTASIDTEIDAIFATITREE